MYEDLHDNNARKERKEDDGEEPETGFNFLGCHAVCCLEPAHTMLCFLIVRHTEAFPIMRLIETPGDCSVAILVAGRVCTLRTGLSSCLGWA